MSAPTPSPDPASSPLAGEAAKLRQFAGSAEEFWPAFLKLAGEVAGAARATLIRRDQTDGRWKQLAEWGPPTASAAGLAVFRGALLSVADECGASGSVKRVLGPESKPAGLVPVALAMKLTTGSPSEVCLVAVFLPQAHPGTFDATLLQLQLLADIPKSFQEQIQSRQARGDVEKLAVVLDTLAEVNSQPRYAAATLALCNSLASRLKCERVSFGWFERGFVRLQAISRTERFDRKMAAVEGIEKAMEEALDQDDEILWPVAASSPLMSREHENFAKANGSSSVCSVPLRRENKVVALVTLERSDGAFNEAELQQLRLIADQVVNRLHDLKRQDRWFGARLANDMRDQLGKILGPEHTWKKAAVLLGAVVLAVLCFVKLNYRVEATYILRSDEVRYVSAPFAGYLQESGVRPGDAVKAGDTLIRLNQDDLLLEEAAGAAELSRYQREAEKARAGNHLAEMRVALSQVEEVKARLSMVRYKLSRSEIKSPFSAVVVEGELKNRLGAPVEQGEVLLRLARTDSLYVEAEVNERDVHEIIGKGTGEIAFVSQPGKRYPVRIERVDPAAVAKEGKNVFLVRCRLEGKPDDWWRPGMSGVCKINVGDRRIIWILTHRTVDFLRLWLWW
jgi:multidrug resistance efflux pump/GAF domain-containing protein